MSRQKCKYSRTSNQKKYILVDLVINKNLKLLYASKLLGIKYSTAKSIMRKYRNKTQSFKQHHNDEETLKKILIKKQSQLQFIRKEIFLISKDSKKKPYLNSSNELKGATYITKELKLLDNGSEIEQMMIDFLRYSLLLNTIY